MAQGAQRSHGEEVDPLQVSIPLTDHHVLFPFGFPIYIKTNEPAIIRAAEESWGAFRQEFNVAPLELRFVVSEVVSRRRPPIPSFRAQANLLVLVADQQNFGCCDLAAGFGFASLTKAATTHRDYIRVHFVEAMVYTLMDTRHTLAIHAACVEFQKQGVLFLGDSGAGKSSLAYAAARRGWGYICDDATSLILRKTGRSVAGNPRTVRFKPAGLDLFPEIQGRRQLRNGKPIIEIPTEMLHGVKAVYATNADFLVFLRRSAETVAPSLRPVSPRDVFRRLSTNPWPGELAVQEQKSQAIERLMGATAFELEYREFDPAIDLLEGVIRGNGQLV